MSTKSDDELRAKLSLLNERFPGGFDAATIFELAAVVGDLTWSEFQRMFGLEQMEVLRKSMPKAPRDTVPLLDPEIKLEPE
jgi:hypothetical protein